MSSAPAEVLAIMEVASMASKKTSGGRPPEKGKKPGAKPGTPAAKKGSTTGGKTSKRPPDNKAKNPKKKK